MEYNDLHLETITPQLSNILQQLMTDPMLTDFRLVGGTNLSLRYGHRYSVDIDMFTSVPYGGIDFSTIDYHLSSSFPYCDYFNGPIAFGRTYYIGVSEEECIKLDLMYTDTFLDPTEYYGDVRMASARDIAAMKMDAVFTGGRKKDIWDLDYLSDNVFSLDEMCNFHSMRQPHLHDRKKLLERVKDFSEIDAQDNPICLLGKDWDTIKMNTIDRASSCLNTYTKLLSKYGADALEQDVEILLSQPVYSNRRFLGDMCRYKYKGEVQTIIL